ncbi:MAG: Lrp/AsnC ligand binding domain-containing protein [Nitrospirota bacterium]
MVTALVLLNIERGKINTVAEKLAEMEGISEVYSIAGRFDLAVIIRAKDNDQLAELITNHMLKVDGILKSETLISFRVYSKHDLDSMFSIGM